jgi:hypothetical protein
MSKEPEEQGEAEAEDEAGDDGKVEGGVFAAVDDVTGKAAEAEGQFSAKVKKCAYDDKEPAEHEEGAAEFANRVHCRILPQAVETSPKAACHCLLNIRDIYILSMYGVYTSLVT